MLNVNVSAFAKPVIQQRRFKYLLIGLGFLSLVFGLIVVPIERGADNSQIVSWFDGIWWGVITVTGVGYGDVFPVTVAGRVIAMILSGIGVLAYGLVIAMFSSALQDTRERYYRQKTFASFEEISRRLDRIEKNESYMVKKEMGNQEIRQRDSETVRF